MNNIKSLIKNPIGIIGLFISFVYAIASLILGIGINSLTIGERIAFIAFIIGLPIYVFYHFVDLVKKHHKKLYGPGDYQTDGAFLNTIDDYIDRTAAAGVNTTSSGDSSNDEKNPNYKQKFGLLREEDFRAYAVLYFSLTELSEDKRKKYFEMLHGNATNILRKIEEDMLESDVIKSEEKIIF